MSNYGADRIHVRVQVSLCADAAIPPQLAVLSFGFPPVSSPSTRIMAPSLREWSVQLRIL
jgi:hypothetical protein